MRSSDYTKDTSLDAQCAAWLREVRSCVAPRPGLVLDPRRCALLVIDMLHYFADPGGRCYLPATAAIVPRIGALLEAWRGLSAPVIFTRHAHEGDHDLGMLGRFYSDHIRAGRPEAETIAPLAPRPGEPVLRKTTYDAFIGTPLEQTLRDRGAEQVLVTGVLTHMCCETTARAAFCRGWEVHVAADATASSSQARHLAALVSMADCVAVVHSVREILQRCAPRT